MGIITISASPARPGADPAAAARAVAGPGALAPGASAPPFTAARLDGGTLSLASLRGRVVLLDFWAVACPPCRIEMPRLEEIHRRHAGRGLEVVGVTEMDPPRDAAVRAVAEAGATYPIVLDPGGRIAALYGIETHPTTLVIDARGRVRFVNAGYLRGEERDIEQAIDAALAAARGEP